MCTKMFGKLLIGTIRYIDDIVYNNVKCCSKRITFCLHNVAVLQMNWTQLVIMWYWATEKNNFFVIFFRCILFNKKQTIYWILFTLIIDDWFWKILDSLYLVDDLPEIFVFKIISNLKTKNVYYYNRWMPVMIERQVNIEFWQKGSLRKAIIFCEKLHTSEWIKKIEIITNSKEGLRSVVTEHFLLLTLARNKGGGTPSGYGKNLWHIKLIASWFLPFKERGYTVIRKRLFLNFIKISYQRFENIYGRKMGAKGSVDLLLPIFGYCVISTIFGRRMKYLADTIWAKFYSDNLIDVWFVNYMGIRRSCHPFLHIPFSVSNRNVWVTSPTKLR